MGGVWLVTGTVCLWAGLTTGDSFQGVGLITGDNYLGAELSRGDSWGHGYLQVTFNPLPT